MHLMLLAQKYVIISITYLTPSELPWEEGLLGIAIASALHQGGWRRSLSEDSAANAVPY